MKTTLVLLTKNEIEGVRTVVPRLPVKEVTEVIAVDGRSTDGTYEYLLEHGIRVIRQETMGRGEAFRLAIEAAEGDVLIFFSPDGNEDPDDIPRFLPLLEKGADIVIGSRMMKGGRNEEDGQYIRIRKWVNLAFGFAANALWNRSGIYVTDTINGYRAIRKSVWNELCLDGPGYTIEYQMTIRAFKKRKRIVEFPTYESGRIGKGGSPGIRTGIAFIRLFIKEVIRSLVKNDVRGS